MYPVKTGIRFQRYAVDRTWRDAQPAACAVPGYDCVHMPGCPDDRIKGAGLDAQCTADTLLFIDSCKIFSRWDDEIWVLHRKSILRACQG